MGLIGLLFKSPLAFVLLSVLLLYSIIAHELAHGLVASWFGDQTARYAGRLSWNPMSHIDPVGTLMLFLVGVGWARPVPVDYYQLQRSRGGLIAVSLAGCLTNFFIAFMASLLLRIPLIAAVPALVTIFYTLSQINIVLCVFNLIPIPPLDGSRVLATMLPPEARMAMARIEPYGLFIVVALIVTGALYSVIDFGDAIISGLIGVLLAPFH